MWQASSSPQKRIQVVFDATHAFRNYRGWGRYTLELLKAFAKSNAAIDYQVFYHRGGDCDDAFRNQFRHASFRFHPMDVPFAKFDAWEEDRSHSWIEEWFPEADVYHSPTEFAFFTQKIGRVITVHELTPLCLPEMHTSEFVALFKKATEENLLTADAIVTVSRATAKDLHLLYPNLSYEVQPIWNGVDSSFFQNTLQPLSPDQVILFIGPTRDRIKNFSVLAEALESFPQVRLRIVSNEEGLSNRELSEKFPSLGKISQIQILKNLSDAELTSLYQTSQLLVFPSLHEGFGLPVAEAMAAGCPVLCGKHSSLEEITDGKGFYFDSYSVSSLKEKLGDFFQSRENIDRQWAWEYARENFSWDACARAHELVYEQIANKTFRR